MSLRHYRKASQIQLSLQPNTSSQSDRTIKDPNDDTVDTVLTGATRTNINNKIDLVADSSSSLPVLEYGSLITKGQEVDNRRPIVSHTETGSIVISNNNNNNNIVNDDGQTNVSNDAAAFVCIPVSGTTSTISMPQVIVLHEDTDTSSTGGVVDETEKPCCAICLQSDTHFLTEETNADVMAAISKSLRTALKFHSTLKIFICELCRLVAAIVNSYSNFCGGTEPSTTAIECIEKLTAFWNNHRPQQKGVQQFCNLSLAPHNTFLGTHSTAPATFTIPTVQLVAPFTTVPVLLSQPTYPFQTSVPYTKTEKIPADFQILSQSSTALPEKNTHPSTTEALSSGHPGEQIKDGIGPEAQSYKNYQQTASNIVDELLATNSSSIPNESQTEFRTNQTSLDFQSNQILSQSSANDPVYSIDGSLTSKTSYNTQIEYSTLKDPIGLVQMNFTKNERNEQNEHNEHNEQNENLFTPHPCFDDFSSSFHPTPSSTETCLKAKITVTGTVPFIKSHSPVPSTSRSFNDSNSKPNEIPNSDHVEFLQFPEPLPTASSIIEEPPIIDDKSQDNSHVGFYLEKNTLADSSFKVQQEESCQSVSASYDDQSSNTHSNNWPEQSQTSTCIDAPDDSCSTIILSSSSSTTTLEELVNYNDDSAQTIQDTKFEFVSSFTEIDDNSKTTCSVCHKKFNDLRGLRCHERAHNKVQSKPIQTTNGFMCKVCNEVMKDKNEYKKHTKRHYAASFYRAQKAKGPKLCTYCGGSFYVLSQHVLCCKAIPRERVKCFFEGCGKYYISEKQLQKHQHRVHLKATSKPCGICGKMLASTDALRRHVNFKHKNIRNFTCTICPKKFHTAFHLRMHLRSHDRAPLYNCPYCSASFVYNHVLKMHMRKNHGEQQVESDDFQNIKLEQWKDDMPLARVDSAGPNDQWLF